MDDGINDGITVTICLSCGNEISDLAERCPECGQPLSDTAERAAGPADVLDTSLPIPPESESMSTSEHTPEPDGEVATPVPADGEVAAEPLPEAGTAGPLPDGEAPAVATAATPPAATPAEAAPAAPSRRHRFVVMAIVAGVVLAAFAGLVVAALVAWPHAELASSPDALARIDLPAFAGQVTAVDVRSASGDPVPVQLRQGALWPLSKLPAGEWLTIDVTVLRPSWAGWLVGDSSSSRFTTETPSVHLRSNWLLVKTDTPASLTFDAPVESLAIGGLSPQTLASPQTIVSLGVVAHGSESAGAIEVAAAARSWEVLPAPTWVSWFVARPYPQMLVEPATTATLAPGAQLTFTFSDSIANVLGSARPRLTPSIPGSWQTLDAHTLAFQPSGLGFALGTTVRVELPRPVHLAARSGAKLTSALQWKVASGSTLRLEQLLAQVGYLPLDWQPASTPASDSPAVELAAALSPPPGQFVWRYPNTPPELQALWREGQPNKIVLGAVMMFESTHGMAVDGLAGPKVWAALISDVLAGKRDSNDYNYVFVHRNQPQKLSLWHDGSVIFTSPGNTGVPAAPTQLGTFPVFEHILVGTMSGRNPDGSKYNDPGIRYISYFNGGDALHSFNRASFGTPQSLGCVELPLAAAAKVWPYTPIGTLVTIEN